MTDRGYATTSTRRVPEGPSRSTGSWRSRLTGRGLDVASWIACRLPERLAVRLAELAGDAWYRRAPAKRRLARANLHRVVTWMAGQQVGDPDAWPAATDSVALDTLVRSAFRHYARNYLETMRAPDMGGAYVRERTSLENPAAVDAAFEVDGPMIFIGLHFGSLELPGFYLVERAGRPVTAPMESVDDPAIQAWFVRTRGVVGVRLVGLREARRELAAALERGEIAGLIADRDVTGGGVELAFFGAP
ncbi:MAG: lysophospholipid acyltransferase family protein, partial [Candidatus Limnocylindrales bacterium]